MTSRLRPVRFVVLLVTVSFLVSVPRTFGQSGDQAPPKQQFVTGLAQFTEALAGTYGDEGPQVRSSLGAMRQALAQWELSISAYERAIAAQISGAEPRRAAEMRRALVLLYLDRGRIEDAQRELTAATELDPTRADAWLLLGLVRIRLNRPPEAVQALRESSRLDPGNPVTFYLLATELLTIGELDEAARARQHFVDTQSRTLSGPSPTKPAGPPFLQFGLLQEAADSEPFFAPAPYAQGFALLRQGRYEEAMVRFEEAVATDPLAADPTSVTARMAPGSAALRQGQLATAVDHLEAAVAIAPDHPEAHRILGTIYQASGQPANSLAQLEAAIRLNPEDERSRVALANVLVADARFADAERALEDAVQAIPTSGHLHFTLAQVSSTLKRYPKALREFGEAARLAPVVGLDRLYRAMDELPNSLDRNSETTLARQLDRVALDPNNPDAHTALGATYLELNRRDEAVAEFLAALMIDPQRTSAAAALGQAYLRMGDYADAAAAARRALDHDSRHAGARYTLATALSRLGRLDESKEEFDRYRQMLTDAQAGRLRDFEVGLLMRDVRESVDRGALDEAIARLREAILLKPDDAALHVSLGLFLRETGRPADAIESLERALTLNADREVHLYLADIYTAQGQIGDARAHRDMYERLGGK